MRTCFLNLLVCPECRGPLRLVATPEPPGDRVREGRLGCGACGKDYPISGGIPRFVSAEHYAGNFGYEWNLHARTQYDRESGAGDSRKRFFSESRWPERMEGELLLEVGCGSGRFTEQAALTGATVVSMDLSSAVEANYRSNGGRDNVLIVQADLYSPPFPREGFDRVFCFGVLQHTPDVKKAFMTLVGFVRPGGYLAVDVYAKMPGVVPFLLRLTSTFYRVRAFTRRMKPEKLYRWCSAYLNFMWPLAKRISRLGRAGEFILRRLLIPPYFRAYDLPEDTLKEWMLLDMFDGLSPMYDSPQFLTTVRDWFEEAGLQDVEVVYGVNGINGRGRKPAAR